MEVITIGLTSADTDAAHLQSALSYGAAHQAKVQLVIQGDYEPPALDALIEQELERVSAKLRVLPPEIEVHWPEASARAYGIAE